MDDDVRRLVGMLERVKRTIGPAGGIVRVMKGVTDSQRRNYLRLLDAAYAGAKTIQDDLSR